MDLTLVSIDNNETARLFPQVGFDASGLASTLRDRRLHLSYTEDSLSEALAVEPVAAFERLGRIAELERVAGPEWFSVGAGLRAIIDHELESIDQPSGPKFPRYSAELQREWLSRLAGSREAFEEWHQNELSEIKRWSNAEGRLAKDQADSMRGFSSYEQFVERYPSSVAAAEADGRDLPAIYEAVTKRLATPAATQELLKEEIAKIPDLTSNWVVEMLVEKEGLRACVTPELCPTLAAYAGAVSLNRCGATLGVKKDWNPYGWMAPALNDYTDARIIAQAAYAHVLVSQDKGLCRRSKFLQELGLFRPEVVRWDELLARPV